MTYPDMLLAAIWLSEAKPWYWVLDEREDKPWNRTEPGRVLVLGSENEFVDYFTHAEFVEWCKGLGYQPEETKE